MPLIKADFCYILIYIYIYIWFFCGGNANHKIQLLQLNSLYVIDTLIGLIFARLNSFGFGFFVDFFWIYFRDLMEFQEKKTNKNASNNYSLNGFIFVSHNWWFSCFRDINFSKSWNLILWVINPIKVI